MLKEIRALEAGKLYKYNGFLNINKPMKCIVPENKTETWIFQLQSFDGIDIDIIIGITQKEECLEVQKLEYPVCENAGVFINQYLKKYCKMYRGNVLVEMEEWKDEFEI